MSTHIERVPVPESADATPSWQIQGMAAVERAHLQDVFGNTDLATTAEQMVVSYANQKHTIKERYVVVDADGGQHPESVLAVAWLGFPTSDNTHCAHVEVAVHPNHRRRGYATALWDHVAPRITERGRTAVMASTVQSGEPPEDSPYALQAPTGSGRVDLRAPGVVLTRKLGFDLAQVERHSMQEVPREPEELERFRAEAAERATDAYDLVQWQGAVPEEWIEEMVKLQVAMSIDIPTGELDYQEEQWDAERVRYQDEISAKAGFRGYTTAARHVETGELAGYTQIEVEGHNPEVGFQENTLVLNAHRGHRLGMLVKAANLQWLAQAEPQLRRVHTWNAEENDYMLNINVALGYRVASAWGEWQLTLPGGDAEAADA